MCLDAVLCFKHRRRVARDNTVKYRWRTLQLLPSRDQPSSAGVTVEVIESLDSQLSMQYRGETIPTLEAPPRPGILRNFNGRSSHQDMPHLYGNGIGRRWAEVLASLDKERVAGAARDGVAANGAARVQRNATGSRRKPTPLQVARWTAVQKAKRRGLSIRGVARELGIRRSTAKKYMEAASPPLARHRVPVGSSGSANMAS